MTSLRFPIRFTGLNKAMVVLGLHSKNSFVEVDDDEIRVRMGWAFRGTVPRSSTRSVTDDTERVLGWGVHGWRGKWLVNGSSSGIVRLDIDPEARVRVAGVPVRLRILRVSVEDPAGLCAALQPSS